MMITRISKQNEEYFIPLLHEQAGNESPDILRIGVTDDENKAAGALSAIVGQKDILLLSVYVDPGSRRQGYGRALVDSLAALADASDCDVISVYAKGGDETEGFLSALGFELFETVGTCSVRMCDILKPEKLKKQLLRSVSSDIRAISSLDIKELRRFRSFLSENRIYAGALYDRDCSTVHISGDSILSATLVKSFPGGMDVTCTAAPGENVKEAFTHIAALVQYRLRDPDYDLTSEIRLVSSDRVFTDVFTAVEINTGHIAGRDKMIHGIRML